MLSNDQKFAMLKAAVMGACDHVGAETRKHMNDLHIRSEREMELVDWTVLHMQENIRLMIENLHYKEGGSDDGSANT